jgi:hypothetical protein
MRRKLFLESFLLAQKGAEQVSNAVPIVVTPLGPQGAQLCYAMRLLADVRDRRIDSVNHLRQNV